MHCLRNVLLYVILIPMPSASPIFLAAFAIAAYWAIRPCGYCMTILAILFFSTSPSSPFLIALSDDPPRTALPVSSSSSDSAVGGAPPSPSTAASTYPYDTHLPNRGAFCLNGGRVFDPVLVGYQEMQRVWHDIVDSTDGAVANGDAAYSSGASADGEGAADASAASTGAAAAGSTSLGWWPGRWSLGMSAVGRSARVQDPAARGYVSTRAGGAQTTSTGTGASTAAAEADDALYGDAEQLDSQPQSVPASASSSSTDHPRLPPGYVDLRLGGVGLVLDLGWRRTDEALHWEVVDVRSAVEAKRRRRGGGGGGGGQKVVKKGGDKTGAAAVEGGNSGGESVAAEGGEAKESSGWMRASFMDSW